MSDARQAVHGAVGRRLCDWQPQNMTPEEDGNKYTYDFDPESGKKYLYKFVVDGEWVLQDGVATATTEDGAVNHVITEAESSAAVAKRKKNQKKKAKKKAKAAAARSIRIPVRPRNPPSLLLPLPRPRPLP